MEQALSDNHVGFCDMILLWCRLYLTIMLVSVTYFSMEQTLSDNHVGFCDLILLWCRLYSDNHVGFCDMILVWSRLYLTIMLVSVTYFSYGVFYLTYFIL
jgi:hypothetical protein